MLIKNHLLNGYVKEVCPKIFAVVIKNNYDRAMLFCRYSEFYESPYKEIIGKDISLEYLMKIYIKKLKDTSFRYHHHWDGYNLSSKIIQNAYNTFTHKTEYDTIMFNILNFCKTKFNNNEDEFYVIGVEKLEGEITRHEISHALYYMNDDYKSEINMLIKNMDISTYKLIKKKLIKLGYSSKKNIIDDEIQAILTGQLDEKFNKIHRIREYNKYFVKVFKNYNCL